MAACVGTDLLIQTLSPMLDKDSKQDLFPKYYLSFLFLGFSGVNKIEEGKQQFENSCSLEE